MSYPFQVGTFRFGPMANIVSLLETLLSANIVYLNQFMKSFIVLLQHPHHVHFGVSISKMFFVSLYVQ